MTFVRKNVVFTFFKNKISLWVTYEFHRGCLREVSRRQNEASEAVEAS